MQVSIKFKFHLALGLTMTNIYTGEGETTEGATSAAFKAMGEDCFSKKVIL